MNIAWIFSDSLNLDPTIDIRTIKNIGSTWGSWQTWRAYQTDNVICNDFQKAQELVKKTFHTRCNFYIPNDFFLNLGRPNPVHVFEGKFIHDVKHQEEIIAMHLCSSSSDIVLLLGFDFSEPTKFDDKLQQHRAHNYRSLVKQAIVNSSTVQWVLVDHDKPIMDDYKTLTNLTKDTFSSVQNLLN